MRFGWLGSEEPYSVDQKGLKYIMLEDNVRL